MTKRGGGYVARLDNDNGTLGTREAARVAPPFPSSGAIAITDNSRDYRRARTRGKSRSAVVYIGAAKLLLIARGGESVCVRARAECGFLARSDNSSAAGKRERRV